MSSLDRDSLIKIWDHHNELVDCAIDADDHAIDDWFAVLTALKQRIDAWLEAHEILYRIVIVEGQKKIGDWLYKYIVAGSDTEQLLNCIAPQLHRVFSFEELESYLHLPWACARGRMSFQAKLDFIQVPEDLDVHNEIRGRAGALLRQIDLTLAESPAVDQSRVVWALGLMHQQPSKPTWNAQAKELRLGGLLCKKFSRPAHNQIRILDAFQEEGWTSRIFDPFTGGRLKATVGDLNEGLQGLRFHVDGDGVRWRII